MQRTVGLSLAILLCLTAVAQAVPTVVVGNHILQPNMAGQTIQISVSGIVPNATTSPADDSNVNGGLFSFSVDGGGPNYGNPAGPIITNMDFLSGPTIWVAPSTPSGIGTPADYYDPSNQLASSGFLTLSNGFVNVTGGLLVTLTIDTTGFGPGVHGLEMISLALEDQTGVTQFTGGNSVQDITNGQITIVPEPSSVVLGLFAVAGLGAVAIRKRRARRA